MKKHLPFWILLSLLPCFSISQAQVAIKPAIFDFKGKPTEPLIKYDVKVINTSGDSVKLLWSQRLNNVPAPWQSYICDKNLCYDTSIYSCPVENPNILAAGDSMLIQMHLLPHGVEGTGEYAVNLLDTVGNVVGTITGNLIINLSSSSSQAEKNSKLSVFPNPASDYFQTSDLPGLKVVEIFNLVGRKMKSFDAAPQQQYFVGDLSEGIYLVALVDAYGKKLKTVRLSIQ